MKSSAPFGLRVDPKGCVLSAYKALLLIPYEYPFRVENQDIYARLLDWYAAVTEQEKQGLQDACEAEANRLAGRAPWARLTEAFTADTPECRIVIEALAKLSRGDI
jgi:hypothetical protein